ncbi:MAG TPA: NADAR family protein [Candidatus Didemnitutus sp.]|nr:NADAR family protein [Candidatus Didemnitutus sp.]
MTDKFTFFWTDADVFSNWFPAHIEIEDEVEGLLTFENSEQLFMFLKAQCFKDEETSRKILQTPNPRDVKALGRQVKGFDEAVWERESGVAMYAANYFKFTQNPAMLKQLLLTIKTTLVEASPYDRIWGIGMKENDPRAVDPTKWEGLNKLGFILSDLAKDIIMERPLQCVESMIP